MLARHPAILAGVVALLSCTGCTRRVAAPPAPAASLPMPVERPAPAEGEEDDHGEATVVIGTDVPARVDRNMLTVAGVFGQTRWGRLERVCPVTPCTVTLPYGVQGLVFTAIDDSNRVSSAVVRIRHDTEVVNHTLGRDRTSFGTMAGGFLVAAGVLTLLLPFGIDLDSHKSLPDAMIGAGIGGIFTGFTLMAFDPNTKQSGATTQWQPEGSRLPPPATLPVGPIGRRSPESAPVGMVGTSFGFRF